MRNPIRFPILILAVTAGSWAQPDTAWMPLFAGKDMAKWAFSKDCWRADSGMLIGQGKSVFSTFCHTRKAYSDFVFSGWTRLWETSAGYANSGIQYRSGFIDSMTHRMQGYQWDIGGGFDGSILPENGFPQDAPPREVSEACRGTIRKNGWNHVVITADRGVIRHELNGVTCLEFHASVSEGYIGLQFPATSTVMKVDFRDLLIRPLNGSFAIPDSEVVYQPEYAAGGIALLRPPMSPRGIRSEQETVLFGPGFPGAAIRYRVFDARGRALRLPD